VSWEGRFPKNDIASLLEVDRRFNLAESTSRDLYFDELIELVGHDAVAGLRLGYGPLQGVEILRNAVAELCGAPAENVISTQGTAFALYLCALELCRPGDEVVLLSPCFPPSRNALLGSGLVVRELPAKFADSYRLDLELLGQLLTPATRLVSLSTPQNPSGVTIAAAEIEAVLERMDTLAPGALLLVDETYREASYGDSAPAASFAGRHSRLITASSVSKAYGAPGLRVGWMTVADASVRERLLTAKLNMVISGSTLDETLAAHLLQRRERVLGPRRSGLKQALQLVEAWQQQASEQVQWVRPDAGALCCMRLREGAFDDAAVTRFWDALPKLDLQLARGDWFGESERVFRLGFGYLPLATLPAALASLTSALQGARA
jgi:aspartate/methionine/tyrosine aminotransferase